MIDLSTHAGFAAAKLARKTAQATFGAQSDEAIAAAEAEKVAMNEASIAITGNELPYT